MTRANYILMIVMLISCISMFSFFPFLVTILTGSYTFSPSDTGIMMSVGIIAGNLFSVVICMFLSENIYKSTFIASLIFFSLSVLGFIFIKNIPDNFYQYIFLVCCVVFYRFSVGVYYNISRAYQMNLLDNKNDKLRLFSNIKFVNSLGGGAGPVIGQLLINYGGYDALLTFCSSLFLLASLLVILFVPSLKQHNKEKIENIFKGMQWVIKDKFFILISLGAMFHYVFEAQIYTFITLKIKENNINDGIAYMFSLNSIFLLVFAFFGGKLTEVIRKVPKLLLLVIGSFCSCASLIVTPLVTGYPGLAFVAFIFSLGEYLVPQLTVDLITDVTERTLQRITLFNFMTSAIGLGIGFIYGSYLSTVDSLFFTSLSWLSVFLFVYILFSMGLKVKAQELNK